MANPKKICILLNVSTAVRAKWTLREIIFPFQETTFVCCDATSWRYSKTVAFKNNDYVIFILLVLLNRAVKITFLLGKS